MLPVSAIPLTCSLALSPTLAAQGTDTPDRPAESTESLPLETPPSPGCKLRVTPYVWIPAQQGDVSIRGNAAEVDLSIADTLDLVAENFNFAASLRLELERGPWTVLADAMYLSIEADDAALSNDSADIRQDQGIFELGLAYAALEQHRDEGLAFRIEPLAGVRVHHLELDIDSRMSGAFSGDQTWADAFAGVRGRMAVTDRLSLFARADIGVGGSDLTWNTLGGVKFDVSDCIGIVAGYRALYIDYSDGHGAERFRYDATLHGPFAALTISF